MNNLFVAICMLLAVMIVHADVVDIYLENSKEPFLKCGKENGFTEQSMRDVFDKDAKGGLDGASCLRACTLKSMNLMKDSKLNLEKINDFLKTAHSDHPEMLSAGQKAAAVCVEKVKTTIDECKLAYSFVDCFLDEH